MEAIVDLVELHRLARVFVLLDTHRSTLLSLLLSLTPAVLLCPLQQT